MSYLPNCRPEFNQKERLNADLKQTMGRKLPVRTKAKLRNATHAHMAMVERSPASVRRFFQYPGTLMPLNTSWGRINSLIADYDE